MSVLSKFLIEVSLKFTLAKSLIDNLKSNPKESQDDKNRKKWEKLIINTYNSKMQIDREHLYAKLMDKFSTEEEVKNILTEMKIKLKEFDYIIKKQWQVLKKFNLQENIYREESRSLFQTEKQRLNEILKLTIEKLTVCHISGFEPPSIIKNKILSKLQKKFNIEDSVLNQLRNIFIQVKFLQEEEQLTGKRYEDQMYVVEKILNSNTICIPSNMLGHDISRNVYFQAKQESKRYEKELELKSGKEIRPDLNNFDNFDVNNLSNNPNAPLGKKSSSTINFEKDIDMIHIKDNKSAIALTEDTTYFR